MSMDLGWRDHKVRGLCRARKAYRIIFEESKSVKSSSLLAWVVPDKRGLAVATLSSWTYASSRVTRVISKREILGIPMGLPSRPRVERGPIDASIGRCQGGAPSRLPRGLSPSCALYSSKSIAGIRAESRHRAVGI
ncbi:hypothetical protein KM043_002647 [Ampulex compressa]|nr:hypothetical protein KM043_002647 [Ampulex compressa]